MNIKFYMMEKEDEFIYPLLEDITMGKLFVYDQ